MTFGFPSNARTGVRVYGYNSTDADDVPAGGTATSTGLSITWQDGPVDRASGQEPNGAFVEDVLEVCLRRLVFYQDSPFACLQNAGAAQHIRQAVDCLNARRDDREARGVQGKNEV